MLKTVFTIAAMCVLLCSASFVVAGDIVKPTTKEYELYHAVQAEFLDLVRAYVNTGKKYELEVPSPTIDFYKDDGELDKEKWNNSQQMKNYNKKMLVNARFCVGQVANKYKITTNEVDIACAKVIAFQMARDQ